MFMVYPQLAGISVHFIPCFMTINLFVLSFKVNVFFRIEHRISCWAHLQELTESRSSSHLS